jgi:putative phosphoesterase
MTSIGIISDIHADLDGLERALELLKSHNVDEIWCAGDLVDRGADGKAVVKRIRHEQIPTVQGNHDFSARKSQEWIVANAPHLEDYFIENPDVSEKAKKKLLISELSKINLMFLDYLPPALKFERDGIMVELTHANTFDQMTYIYPNSKPSLLLDTLNATVADLVILGHTHKPMKIYHNGTLRIINSGSVAKNYGTPEQSCGILSLPERDFTVYDLQTQKAVSVPTVQLGNNSTHQ